MFVHRRWSKAALARGSPGPRGEPNTAGSLQLLRARGTATGRSTRSPAFDLNGRRPAFLNQPTRVSHRFAFVDLIRHKWQIGHHQRALGSANDGPRVMDHHVERHRHGRVVPHDDHAKRIADQEDFNAGTIQQPPWWRRRPSASRSCHPGVSSPSSQAHERVSHDSSSPNRLMHRL